MEENTTQTTSTFDEEYINKLQDLKNNTVSKAEYARLQAQNKQLLDAMFNGAAQAEQTEVVEVDIDGLRKELYSGKFMTDYDYISKTLQLRKALMDKGEPDPFIGRGAKCSPTPADFANAAEVANQLQNIVDRADGDSGYFKSELTRLVKF